MSKLNPEGWIRVLTVTALLVGVLLAGVAILQHYRRRMEDDSPARRDMLSQFQEAYDSGEMDDAEFRRVRDLLVGRMVPKKDTASSANSGAKEGPSPGPDRPSESADPATT